MTFLWSQYIQKTERGTGLGICMDRDITFRVFGICMAVWILLVFHCVSQSTSLMSIIATYLTLSFPVEEIARGTFPLWKDPLSERLFVF